MNKIWNSTVNAIDDAFNLPEGRYAANVGILVEQSVSPDHVLKAATAIKQSGLEVVVGSQAGIICKSQELGLAVRREAPRSIA